MSEQSTTGQGGFTGELADGYTLPAAGGCCGTPAATGAGSASSGAAGPCCGTAEAASEAGACCDPAAKTAAVNAGAGCCG